MPLRTLFFGSPQFAVPTFRSLANDERFSLDLVITQPDRPSGRGRKLVEPPVKSAAQDAGVPVWQPETLRTIDARERLAECDADLFVVVAYGELFKRSILQLPRHGCLNVHPSLLPRYRGSAPIQAAILNGDRETGVSIIQMVRRLDAGPIVAQQRISLDGSETGGSLGEALAELSARMIPDVAVAWSTNTIEALPQNEDEASYTRELRKSDGLIDWTEPSSAIERKVRAYSPWPSAWTRLNGRRVVIVASEAIDGSDDAQPGSVTHSKNGVIVACGAGSLRLVSVQPEGRSTMPAESWFRGLRPSDRLCFERSTKGDDDTVEIDGRA
ncbi:MAG TPA: methionyl-tRNA formyltransferase [Nitrolancea sp.]|nr:methionyl-tRNA formyltransferase [Nitrolancea sp.]